MNPTDAEHVQPVGPLFRITDEELQLLGAADDVDTPYFDRLDPAHRAVALDVAYRSLCAHGVCEAQGGGLLVPGELVHLLQVRSSPDRRYRVEVRGDGIHSVRHLYEAGAMTVCEDVSVDGLHDFDIVPGSRAFGLLVAVLTPPLAAMPGHEVLQTGCRTAGDLRLSTEPAPWGVVRCTADVTDRFGGGEELVSIIWGDAGTYLVSAAPGRGTSRVARGGLVALIAAQLGIDRAS